MQFASNFCFLASQNISIKYTNAQIYNIDLTL